MIIKNMYYFMRLDEGLTGIPLREKNDSILF